VTSVDPNGTVPLAKILIKGHMTWRGQHPIAAGAQKVDFVADEAYQVTPAIQGFVDILNKVAKDGYDPWVLNGTQEHLRQDIRAVRTRSGEELHGIRPRLRLSRHVVLGCSQPSTGEGFDKEENRPTNLQIPLVRKSR